MDDASFLSKLVDWAVAGLTGYMLYLHNKVTKTEDKVTALELQIARDYVTNAEHEKVSDKIDAKLDLILEKLERKADKH